MGGRNPRSTKKALINGFKSMKPDRLVIKARKAAKEMYDGPIFKLNFKIHALLLQMADALEKQLKDTNGKNDD
jgi:hypothetical protein